MRYEPRLRDQKTAQQVSHEPWPVWGERFTLNGETWFVALFDPGMNTVEIDVPGFIKPPRFFTIADWKRMWSAA